MICAIGQLRCSVGRSLVGAIIDRPRCAINRQTRSSALTDDWWRCIELRWRSRCASRHHTQNILRRINELCSRHRSIVAPTSDLPTAQRRPSIAHIRWLDIVGHVMSFDLAGCFPPDSRSDGKIAYKLTYNVLSIAYRTRSRADAKVSARQQCMCEGPQWRNCQQINDMRYWWLIVTVALLLAVWKIVYMQRLKITIFACCDCRLIYQRNAQH